MIVRLTYVDGTTEEHPLKNGEHFADYIRRWMSREPVCVSAPEQQIRYLAVQPQKAEKIRDIEFLKGPDRTAPVVMAVTVESR